MQKALTTRARINPSRCLSVNTFFFFFGCCLHPDENSGSEEPSEEKDKGGNESQGKGEDKGLEKNDKDDTKSDGGDKEEGEDKGTYIAEPEKSVFVFSSSVMDGKWGGEMVQ